LFIFSQSIFSFTPQGKGARSEGVSKAGRTVLSVGALRALAKLL